MTLHIITKEEELFSGKVDSIMLPGEMGKFQVLKNHMPLVSTLREGIIVYKHDGRKHKLPIKKGMVEVLNNEVNVLLSEV